MVLKKDKIRLLTLPVLLLVASGMLTSCTIGIPGFIEFDIALGRITVDPGGGGVSGTLSANVEFCDLPDIEELRVLADDALAAADLAIPVGNLNITGILVRSMELVVLSGDPSGITDIAISFIAQDGTPTELGTASSASGFSSPIQLTFTDINFLELLDGIDSSDPACPRVQFSGTGELDASITFRVTMTITPQGTIRVG